MDRDGDQDRGAGRQPRRACYLAMMSSQNPVAQWSTGRLALTTSLLSVAVVVAGAMIYASDARLRRLGLPRSAELEWPFVPAAAEKIVEQYVTQGVVADVLRGVALDTFLFIPSYSSLLAVACFWAARAAQPGWLGAGLALGWGGIVAGTLDLIENSGIAVELLLRWSFAAPLTGTVCRLKWALAIACAMYATLVPVLSRLLRP